MADRADTTQGDEVEAQEAGLVCPHCVEPVGPLDHFCPHCASPITAHAAIDPLGQVYAAGHAYRQATGSRPSRIVVLGMWLIFAPQILLLCLGVFSGESAGVVGGGAGLDGWFNGTGYVDGFGSVISFILCLGLLVIYAAILWKVTAGYFASGPPAARHL